MVWVCAARIALQTGPSPVWRRRPVRSLPDGRRAEAAVLAATQRPLATSTFADPSGLPAWQTIPSWDVIGTAD
jgi:hypothetical protein